MRRRIAPLVLAALAACAWHGPQTLQTYPGIENADEVIALDEAAWKLVAVADRRVSTLEDGRMHLAFELANLSAQALSVQVKTTFRDGDGMLTGDQTGWQMLTLPGNGSRLYEIDSLETGVGSYLVEVQTP